MSAPDTARNARKKLLLLEAQLHRLELMQARQDCSSAVRGGLGSAGLPGLLSLLSRQRAGSLLATALPLLLRLLKTGRRTRRALLLLGGGAAALAMFNRWLQREPVDDVNDGRRTDKKNPGQGRD